MLQYYHTAKYLKGRQIIGQVRNRIRTKLEISAPRSHFKAPAYTGCIWSKSVVLPAAGGQGALQPHSLEGRYTFLNRTEQLGWPPCWDNPELPKLWLYNLHYFDWIWNLECEQARCAASDWMAHYLLDRNQTGWEPYPVSLRLMNWTGFFFGKNRTKTESDREFAAKIWRSIHLHASWLMRSLESHLLANHLFENAAALALTGSCFEGAEARGWRAKGLAILEQEIAEQILLDGMHFERSPMYHSRIFYVLLLLAATGDPQLARQVKEPISRMSKALTKLVHPDGRIALLNDSAFGIYHEPGELLDYAHTLFPADAPRMGMPEGPFALKDAGYYGWRSPGGHYVICDAGPIGPDYQPGHAHAGIFSSSFLYAAGESLSIVESAAMSRGTTAATAGQHAPTTRSRLPAGINAKCGAAFESPGGRMCGCLSGGHPPRDLRCMPFMTATSDCGRDCATPAALTGMRPAACR